MKASRIVTLGAAALALGFAAPSAALDDMTGSYTGKMSCKGYVGGAPAKAKSEIAVTVVEGKGVRMSITTAGVPFGDTVALYKLEDETKPDRAKIQGLDCTSNVESPQSLTVQGDVVVKPGTGKGTIKGSVIRRDATGMPGTISVCTFSVKRTSTELPEVPECPLSET
jgi:hypothetical protein